jgi:hypothetical protein
MKTTKQMIFVFLAFFAYSQTINCKTKIFKLQQSPFSKKELLITNPRNLLTVAKSTLQNLKNYKYYKDSDIEINSKLFRSKKTYIQHTKKTLSQLIKTLSSKQKIDYDYLNKNFHCINWSADTQSAKKHNVNIPNGKIRLTKYLIYKFKGSYTKTAEYPYALYKLPKDEHKLSEKQAERKKDKLIRFRYTKQDIVNGALETKRNTKKVNPLVWLSRSGLEEALMQGTIIVEMPDKKYNAFNVHKNNGIDYDKTLKNKRLQKRYWYFREITDVKGYGKNASSKIKIRPKVTFAGDVSNIGLGQLVAIRYTNRITKKPEIRLGIIADTGGAFTDNMYQLDYFVGAFNTKKSFKKYIQKLPDAPQAFILVSK